MTTPPIGPGPGQPAGDGGPDRPRTPSAGGARGRGPGRRSDRDGRTDREGRVERENGRGKSRPPRRPDTQRPPEVDQARQAALDLLAAVRERGAYANLALPRILSERRLSGRDAALATELAYGTCRMMGQLDAVIGAAGSRPLLDLDGPVLDALRLGAYQLLHTRVATHAAVSVTVDLVRAGPHPGAAGYANAVLRRVAEATLPEWIERLAPDHGTDRIGYLAFATAHPRWITTALDDALNSPEELEQALAADDRPGSVHLVARPGLIGQDDLAAQSGGRPARFSPLGVYLAHGDPGRISAVADGRAAVQDEGSQLVALALVNAPLSGSDARWLDLAAGPGGKAALLGGFAAERGAELDAVEITPHRAGLVAQTVTGLPVTVHTADGRDPGLPEGSYDRVLLDAPCTGLGALRRRPEARWRRQQSDVAPLVRLQRELLESAARMVRPGGIVAYVTCSPHLSETLGVIGRRPAELVQIDARPLLPRVPDLGEGPEVQLWPHRHGTDAMFLALFRRSAASRTP